MTAQLSAREITLGYGDHTVLDGLSLDIPPGRVTTIIGPNGCGKSTLLRALGRLLTPSAGRILLNDKPIADMRPRDVARTIAMLPQTPLAPDGLTVADLVARGRHPHQSWLRQWSADDQAEVAAALDRTGIADLADRPVEQLSGGQRQRAWISMALAQGTDILLLDEPTTYLDLAHAVEVLDLVQDLSTELGRTIVMVLHDLNLAVRYSDRLVVMTDGRIAASGPPQEIIDTALLRNVFHLESHLIEDPISGRPLIVPIGRRRADAPTAPLPAS
ncbi:ABC transporter ATP-binding protein [Nocardia macrotermitis]|uniref:Putative siderophore transport system ATP-binding protein YusV n=1 Tax=Nocardia macrotermitis TaxID=2585198 RepID=A0A7K0DBE8_9NOCA|nr:ABC transporter ATP-binding protein [Nocardia macrotermitis]MQY23116.1 putative siderophore transport system ATP-binding protein YusV [Nocardia macrotermitis]